MKTPANMPLQLRLQGWLHRDGKRTGRVVLMIEHRASVSGDVFELTAIDVCGPNGEYWGTFTEAPE